MCSHSNFEMKSGTLNLLLPWVMFTPILVFSTFQFISYEPIWDRWATLVAAYQNGRAAQEIQIKTKRRKKPQIQTKHNRHYDYKCLYLLALLSSSHLCSLFPPFHRWSSPSVYFSQHAVPSLNLTELICQIVRQILSQHHIIKDYTIHIHMLTEAPHNAHMHTIRIFGKYVNL